MISWSANAADQRPQSILKLWIQNPQLVSEGETPIREMEEMTSFKLRYLPNNGIFAEASACYKGVVEAGGSDNVSLNSSARAPAAPTQGAPVTTREAAENVPREIYVGTAGQDSGPKPEAYTITSTTNTSSTTASSTTGSSAATPSANNSSAKTSAVSTAETDAPIVPTTSGSCMTVVASFAVSIVPALILGY
ncbi:hypothetical protein Aperf_G00000059078 [Anoplocephala perfoliata]